MHGFARFDFEIYFKQQIRCQRQHSDRSKMRVATLICFDAIVVIDFVPFGHIEKMGMLMAALKDPNNSTKN